MKTYIETIAHMVDRLRRAWTVYKLCGYNAVDRLVWTLYYALPR